MSACELQVYKRGVGVCHLAEHPPSLLDNSTRQFDVQPGQLECHVLRVGCAAGILELPIFLDFVYRIREPSFSHTAVNGIAWLVLSSVSYLDGRPHLLNDRGWCPYQRQFGRDELLAIWEHAWVLDGDHIHRKYLSTTLHLFEYEASDQSSLEGSGGHNQ